jgi:hypothetical protein
VTEGERLRAPQQAYGIVLESDWRIPGLADAAAGAVAALTITFDQEAARMVEDSCEWSEHESVADRRTAVAGVSGVRVESAAVTGHTRLVYSDGARFVLDVSASRVWVLLAEGMSRESASTYLVNPVLAYCARLRGARSLHASGIVIDDGAVLFLGPSGAGKSTLAYGLATRGHALLTDDVAVVEPGPSEGPSWSVQPGYPRLRLWPWTVEELFGAPDALPLISDDWAKRRWDAPRFASQKQPLRAIVLLRRFAEDIAVERCSWVHATKALLDNSYLAHLSDAESRGADFLAFSDLAASVPLLAFDRPQRFDALDEACEIIEKSIRGS